VMDALKAHMYAMAAVSASSPEDFPPYTRVRRRDRYTIAPEATYDFEIEAECSEPSAFRFLVAGDTPNSNSTIDSVQFVSPRGAAVALSSNQYGTTRNHGHDRIITVHRKRWKSPHHHYRILCRWAGVFDLPLEYIWCPWSVLYPQAAVDYTLELAFVRKPKGAPRMLEVAKTSSLDSLLVAYQADEGVGGVYEHDRGARRHVYRFQSNGRSDLVCFFRP
jgi:hypothetical protein